MIDLQRLSVALLTVTVLTFPSAAGAKALQDPIPPPPEYHDIRAYGLGGASGKPLRTWRGRLSAERENEVLELLSKGERSVAAARKTSHGPILPVRADDDPVLVLDQQRHPLPGTADFSYTLTRSEP